MNIEPGRIINDFIEPNKRQYVIPVYQRNYEWPREQCEKLFDDIIMAYKNDRNHFCGSIIYAPLREEHGIIYYVIVDGQQRLTTIYLLLKALIDSAETDRDKETLTSVLFNMDKFSEYGINEASKLKLKPIKSDNNQLFLLMDNKYDKIDKSSGIWTNYNVFKDKISLLLSTDSGMDIKNIYLGIEKLFCARIKLDASDNAQEIFERINSTGVPLSLSDQIRNYVLMTDVNQEKLYETYWLEIENLLTRDKMSAFFLDYLNLKNDGFTKEKEAYDIFKLLYTRGKYTNESMLQELKHYAEVYSVFLYGSDSYSKKINDDLRGLRLLKQSTVYLFLFSVFDDYQAGVITETELERVLSMLLSYSVRRMMCEIASNSLRGVYKTLYNKVFSQKRNKELYYDSIVSFMFQMTYKDAIPSDDNFRYALIHNNLYQKHALCNFILDKLENQGKEKILTDSLSVEHIMPQNKNLSTAWQEMLGDNWFEDRDKWLHTLGNLTLTGYNSELGDKPFDEKKALIEEKKTKVVFLYQDVQDKKEWNASTIESRANRLAESALQLFAIQRPEKMISFADPRYKEYTCADSGNATYKMVNYYELMGERVVVDSFADMVRSVTKKLYNYDRDIIIRMAKNLELFDGWLNPAFSYDSSDVRNGVRIEGTDIYTVSGLSAYDCISYIRGLIRKYDLDIEEDFIYSARSYKDEHATSVSTVIVVNDLEAAGLKQMDKYSEMVDSLIKTIDYLKTRYEVRLQYNHFENPTKKSSHDLLYRVYTKDTNRDIMWVYYYQLASNYISVETEPEYIAGISKELKGFYRNQIRNAHPCQKLFFTNYDDIRESLIRICDSIDNYLG